MRLHLYILFVLSLLTFRELYSQSSPIIALHPSVEQNQLVVHTQFRNLINDDMQETLASGMSRVLHIHFTLHSTTGTLYVESMQTVTLRYNVWERSYHIRTALQRRELSSVRDFTAFLNDSLRFSLGAIRGFPHTQDLVITTAFSPEPITTAQQSRLHRWLTTASSTDNGRSPDSESTFSINLSSLLTRLMSKQKAERLHVYKSRVFKIENLKNGG